MTAKIVYYGPGLCGKTTNLNIIYARTAQKARGEMVSLNTETDRTLFFDLLPLDVGMVGGFRAKLQLYTVPGQVFYNSTRKLVLKGVDGIVFVADSQVPMLDANKESLQNLASNLKELGLRIGDIPMVFQWNKRDLKNVVPVPTLEAELNPTGCQSFESVAQEGAGVFETMRGITRLALAQIKTLHLWETNGAKGPSEPEPGAGEHALEEPVAAEEHLAEPAAEALSAADFAMPDTQGEDAFEPQPQSLSFLDLPSGSDLFADTGNLGEEPPTESQAEAAGLGMDAPLFPGDPVPEESVFDLLDADGTPVPERLSGHEPASAPAVPSIQLPIPAPVIARDLAQPHVDRVPPRLDPHLPHFDNVPARPSEAATQTMAPLTVKLRPPSPKAAAAALKPMAALKPLSPTVAPRAVISSPKAPSPVANRASSLRANPARVTPVLHLALPADLAEGDLEVTVVIRQHGTVVAEGSVSRGVPAPGSAASVNLELKRS